MFTSMRSIAETCLDSASIPLIRKIVAEYEEKDHRKYHGKAYGQKLAGQGSITR